MDNRIDLSRTPTGPIKRPEPTPKPAPAGPAAPPARPAGSQDAMALAGSPGARPASLKTLPDAAAASRLRGLFNDPNGRRRVPTSEIAGVTMTVTGDPLEVHKPLPEPQRREAAALAEAMQPRIQASLADFPPEQRARFATIDQAVADDPAARAALASLALRPEANLFDARPDGAGRSLLDNLHDLASGAAPLAPGLERQALLSQVLRQLAEPASVNQGVANTCAASALQVLMVAKDPAEFVRVIQGLASPEGSVTLRGGQRAQRAAGFLGGEAQASQALTDRLWAGAMMEVGNGEGWRYDVAHDRSYPVGANEAPPMVGLSEDMYGDLAAALTGQSKRVRWIDSLPTRAAAISALQAALQRGEAVPVGLDFTTMFGSGVHAMIATGMGDGQVQLTNPWGQTESLPEASFKRRLRVVVAD